MASSGSSSMSNNDINPSCIYDVFLSFCDKDASESLASYLYTALTVAGIVVFRDKDKLRNQDQIITPSVLHAIQGSRLSIIVFSKNYADLTWCQQELEKIIEGRKTTHMVVPVFYDVDPSGVLHQEGLLGKASKYLIQRILKKDDLSLSWKKLKKGKLFREVCNVSEFTVHSRKESEDIKKVVDHVTDLLNRRYLFVADHPVGVESRVQDVIQLLKSQESKDPLLLGIWGMGGIGKTTIAKAAYNKVCHGFEAKSFLLNVRDVWEQDNGEVSLQQRLLSDIFKKTKIKIDTVESGKLILQERLRQKRIFLVLDNVTKQDQLDALCGSHKWFGQGSRIIITTRDVDLLCRLKVDHVYRMKEMDDNESLELFSWHAFKQPNPIEGFADLSRDAVKNCGGLPLTLQVIGFSLVTRRRKQEWKSALEKLQLIPEDDSSMSFESLPDNDDLFDYDVKKTFLDIASLNLSGMHRDDIIQIFKKDRNFVELGMNALVERNLVSFDSENRIQIHDWLEDLERGIRKANSVEMLGGKIYDVFLSFRGEDTRAKFISHLYTTLENAGIYVFRDDDEIQRGDHISVSLLRAIGKSRISVVVLSRNYANSRWCMLELENIMYISRTQGMVVVPVFYEIDPSEVRHQTRKFGEDFESLLSKMSVDTPKLSNWKTALAEVGGTAGIVIINSRNENEDIRKVVAHVTKLLDRTDLFVADHPVGVDSRVQDVIQLLKSQESEDPFLLGIWGMGGIGKTTIAKAAYNKIRHNFEAKSFLLNVREVWEQDNGDVSLQQRLLSAIYKTTKIKIDTVESGKLILQERLRQKKIFLVLDDVNKLKQLNALCGSHKWFGQGSRIIITTRDGDLLSRLKVDYVYRMKEMDGNESLELFSWHAFKQPIPIEGFGNLSTDVVKYSGGLPLALQVIGSFLLTRRRKKEWKSVLEKLQLIPNDEVLEKLKISFDGLSDDDVKEIFLDIAFFFIGMDQEDVTTILEGCGHYADIGISVLVQQSLVTVDRKNKIGMHDLLRHMGREIVRNKSIEGGKEPSRLWRYEDVDSVLSKDTRTLDVKGLTLKMSRMDSTTYLETKDFEKLNKLRLLQLAGVQLDGNYKYLSRDIRWLCWHGFPFKYTPAEFHQEHLVAVDLKYSNLERVWKKSQFLKELKYLSHSHNLRQTPDFSKLPNLEKLILKDCPNLSSVSPNIGHLKKILLINLKDCTGLRELPRSIYKLESVKTLIVSGCTKIDRLEEDIEQMTSLTTLYADNTAVTRVPFAVVRSKSIGFISLCGFEGFARNVFPSIIQSWMSPTNDILSLVQTFAGISSLELLDEQNDCFYGLPSIFEDLQKLRRLWLKCESKAQLNQILATILDNKHNTICEELEKMQNTPQSSNFVTSASTHGCSQVRISSSQNCLTSLLIQMGMNCHVSNTLKENILQKMPPNGSGLLPGDNYPDWLAFNDSSSSVTFEVPLVDGRSLKTIICIVYSSSLGDITSEGLKVLLVINCTKNTIQFYKRDALLASFDEEDWQKVVSNTEPGDIVKVIVLFENKFIVKKTTVYLVYDEKDIGSNVREQEDLKRGKKIHDVRVEPSSTEDVIDDAQTISTMFPKLITSEPSSKVHEENISSSAKDTTATMIETVVEEVLSKNVNAPVVDKNTADVQVSEGDKEKDNTEPGDIDKAILRENKECSGESREQEHEDSSPAKGQDKVSSQATSPSKKGGETDEEGPEVSSMKSPKTFNRNSNMRDGLSTPSSLVHEPFDVEFDAEDFQNKLKQNPLAALDDFISSFSTSKNSTVQISQGSESSNSSETTTDSLIRELRTISFEKDLSERSAVGSTLRNVVDSFKPKVLAHEKLFSPLQLEYIKGLIDNLEALLNANNDLESATAQKHHVDKDIELRLQEVTTTRSEIEVQQKKIGKCTSEETEIDNEIIALQNKIKDLETKKQALGQTKEIAARHLNLVIGKAVGQASTLKGLKAKAKTATSQINSAEQKLSTLKSVYLKFKEQSWF